MRVFIPSLIQAKNKVDADAVVLTVSSGRTIHEVARLWENYFPVADYPPKKLLIKTPTSVSYRVGMPSPFDTGLRIELHVGSYQHPVGTYGFNQLFSLTSSPGNSATIQRLSGDQPLPFAQAIVAKHTFDDSRSWTRRNVHLAEQIGQLQRLFSAAESARRDTQLYKVKALVHDWVRQYNAANGGSDIELGFLAAHYYLGYVSSSDALQLKGYFYRNLCLVTLDPFMRREASSLERKQAFEELLRVNTIVFGSATLSEPAIRADLEGPVPEPVQRPAPPGAGFMPGLPPGAEAESFEGPEAPSYNPVTFADAAVLGITGGMGPRQDQSLRDALGNTFEFQGRSMHILTGEAGAREFERAMGDMVLQGSPQRTPPGTPPRTNPAIRARRHT